MAAAYLSHYRLLGLLGVGGMGEVHRAEDTRLRREVAIKILHPEAASSREWLNRFRREARLASALQHPHICTIHELGEHQGQWFIVMERLEGATMRELIEDGPLPPQKVVTFARQVAEALDAAHRRGIIHRDIKPANLFVIHGDFVKVLDFGLARHARDEIAPVSGMVPIPDRASDESLARTTATGRPSALTQTGMAMGTVFYMSPEQARGEPLDARSDLFSLGSVLYEMATGRRAFEGDDIAQILGRITTGVFVPPRTLNPEIPKALEAIILKLLTVNVRERYQSASELLADLARADAPSGSTRTAAIAAPAIASWWTARRAWAVLAGALIVGSLGYAWMTRRTGKLSDRDSIVIGTIENTTGLPVFDNSLAAALAVQLGQSPFLDIVPDSRIAETLRMMGRRPEEPLTHDRARETCQRLGVKAMIDGRIAPLGSHYVLTVMATDCQTGETLARQQAQATSAETVLTELGRMASQLRTTLGESLPSIRRFDVPIAQATTPSLAALKAYALGLEERRRGREVESLAFFNQAIETDPDFAQAHATLSTVYGVLGELERSEHHAREAFERSERVSEHERLFIRYQYHERITGNLDAVIETLRTWQAAYPRDFVPANALAVTFNRLGQYDRAVQAGREALRRVPGHPFAVSNLAVAYRGLGRYEEARRVTDDVVARDEATAPTRRMLYQLGVLMGDPTANRHLAWARGRSREYDLVAAQAQIAMYEGRWDEGERLYRHAADLATAQGLPGAAGGHVAHLAWLEALYRPGTELPARLERLLARTPGPDERVQVQSGNRVRISAALGLAGLRASALRVVSGAEQHSPQSTYVRTVLSPVTRGAVALGEGRPAEAIDALEPARPSEVGTLGVLMATYLRAEAYRRSGQWMPAIREFERLLQHRGTDPHGAVVPMAYLGLAQSRAAVGDTAGARAACEAVLRIWQQADPGFPPLAAVRAEYDRLVGAVSSKEARSAVGPRT